MNPIVSQAGKYCPEERTMMRKAGIAVAIHATPLEPPHQSKGPSERANAARFVVKVVHGKVNGWRAQLATVLGEFPHWASDTEYVLNDPSHDPELQTFLDAYAGLRGEVFDVMRTPQGEVARSDTPAVALSH